METSASPGAPSTSAPSAPLPTAPLPAVPLPTSPSASPSASLAPSPAHEVTQRSFRSIASAPSEAPPNLPRTEGAGAQTFDGNRNSRDLRDLEFHRVGAGAVPKSKSQRFSQACESESQ